MAMTCQHVKRMLSAFGDDELPVADRERIATHLAVCPGCRDAAGRLRRLDALVGGVQTPGLPDGLAVRILIQARERQSRRRFFGSAVFGWWGSEPWLVRAAGVAAVFAGLLLGVWIGGTLGGETAVPAAPARTAFADPAAVYNLDYLRGAPAGSLAQVYLGLPATPREQR